jgi:5-methylcytosine-specific restriction endonuclease McrA
LAKFTPEEILSRISKSDERFDCQVGDKVYQVRMNSHRYFIFRESLKCVSCGIEGTQMILELNPNHKSPHFNLYAVENGKLVLMTKDHVTPKAFGGEDRHSNYQTMCCICNNLKGSASLTLDGVRELREIYNANCSLPRKKLRALLEDAKKRLVLEPRVVPARRKMHMAALKTSLKEVVTTCDISVWKCSDGGLMGRSVYEDGCDDGQHVASIKKGTLLETVVSDDAGRVIVKFTEEETLAVYHGYLGYVEPETMCPELTTLDHEPTITEGLVADSVDSGGDQPCPE